MSFEIKIDSDNGTIRFKTSGDLEASEFYEMIKEAEKLCREKSLKKVFVDHTASTVRNLSADEIHGIALMCTVMNEVMKGGKLAVVMPGDLDYGLGRMWHSYSIDKLEYDSMLFRNLEEAEEWIKNEKGV